MQVILQEAALEFTYTKSRMLLAYLALDAGRVYQRDTLAALFWPELPEPNARTNLRQVLTDLRKALGDATNPEPFLLVQRDSVSFNSAAAVDLDVVKFTALLDACARHRHRHAARCATCAARLEQAVALYRGDLLVGAVADESEMLSDWLRNFREQLHRQALQALTLVAAYFERLGMYELALNSIRRQLELEPWHESAHQAAIRLHALLGDRGTALAQYERCRAVLAAEFGTVPEPATEALYQAVRHAEPISSPYTPAWQLRLPANPSRVVGRNEELGALGELLADPQHRLISIVGPGGVGKTCLAVAVAQTHAYAFAAGAVYLPLAGVNDANLLASTILSALDLTPRPDLTPEAQLIDYLRSKELLLVLDNLEHLLAGVGLIARLLQHTTALTLLVTSRERLALRTEWVFDLTGLAVPSADCADTDVASNAAATLFAQRARQVQRSFDLATEQQAVAQICRMVEGLPLALELAASAVRAAGCASIAAAIGTGIAALRSDLHDLPERQRSMEATFNYSWQLLPTTEQQILRQLGVFRGGFTAEAATTVANATRQQLQALCHKSLLRKVDSQRYDMHELIRQFAIAQLSSTGEAAATHQRHLEAMLALAQQAAPQLTGAEQQHWLGQLERDHNNLRAALTWGLANHALELTAQLGGALGRFWWRRDYLHEGRQWLNQVLQRISASEHGVTPTSHANVLKGLAALASQQGHLEEADHYYQQELDMRRTIGSPAELVTAMSNLAANWSQQGRYAEAEALLFECVALDRAQDDTYGLAHDLGSLGLSKFRQGLYAEAHDLLSESLALHRRLEDSFSVALTLANLGSAAHGLGDFAALGEYTKEALTLMRALNNNYNSAVALENLAYVYRTTGDVHQCKATLRESLTIYLEIGSHDNVLSASGTIAVTVFAPQDAPCVQLLSATLAQHQQSNTPIHTLARSEYDAALATARQSLSDHEFNVLWAAGQAMSFDELVAMAQRCLE